MSNNLITGYTKIGYAMVAQTSVHGDPPEMALDWLTPRQLVSAWRSDRAMFGTAWTWKTVEYNGVQVTGMDATNFVDDLQMEIWAADDAHRPILFNPTGA